MNPTLKPTTLDLSNLSAQDCFDMARVMSQPETFEHKLLTSLLYNMGVLAEVGSTLHFSNNVLYESVMNNLPPNS